jgi:hypothetical protein
VAPGKREYEIIHSFYLYDNQFTEGYKLTGPVMTFSEERVIEDIKTVAGGYLLYNQTQIFKELSNNMKDDDKYRLINYDSAHYLYEISNSPQWLLASQSLSMIYQEFNTAYADKIVFHEYVINGFSEFFQSKDIFFRTLGQYLGKNLTVTQKDLLWNDQNYGFKNCYTNFQNWIKLCNTDQLNWEVENLAFYF